MNKKHTPPQASSNPNCCLSESLEVIKDISLKVVSTD